MHHYINTELGPRDDPHLWVLSLSFRLLVNSIRVSRRWPSSFLFWVAHKALTPIARGHNGSRICFWSPQTLNCSPYCERLRFSLIRDNTIFPILWMLKWIRWCCRLVLKELKERERERARHRCFARRANSETNNFHSFNFVRSWIFKNEMSSLRLLFQKWVLTAGHSNSCGYCLN